MVVPAEAGDAAVVVARVKNHQVKQVAELERPPDAQVVVQIYLPDRHPLKVGSHRVHLALVHADGRAIGAEGLLGVVERAEAVPVAVVGDLWGAG